jgi:hypothetical protein
MVEFVAAFLSACVEGIVDAICEAVASRRKRKDADRK